MIRPLLSALPLFTLLLASAASAEPRLLSVLELRNKLEGADRQAVDAEYVADRIRAEVLQAHLALRVMTRENMLVLLEAQGKSLDSCEGECEVDTARRLGADYVISGELLRVGAQLKASLKLHAVRGGLLLGAQAASGATVDTLDRDLPEQVRALLEPLRAELAPGAPAASTPAPSPAPPSLAAAPASSMPAAPPSEPSPGRGAGAVHMDVAAPPEGRWQLVSAEGASLCLLPCAKPLARDQRYFAELDADVTSERRKVPLPEPAGYADGRSVEARYFSGRGSKTWAIVLLTAGLSAGAWGVGTLSSDSSSGSAKGIIGAGGAALAAGIFLIFYSRDEHYEGALAP